MSMAEPSPLYQLVESKLSGSLADFVAARKATKSWSEIAQDLHLVTGMKVSAQTLANWFAGRITVEVRVS